jgi:hypothetical protein
LDSGLLKLFRQLQNKSQLQLNRKLGLFTFFLVLSAFLWFLNAMSKQYTTVISYPVTFKNMPEDKVLVSKLPESLELKVNAYGYTLFRYSFSASIPPILFDINSFYEKIAVKSNNTNVFIITKIVKNKIEAQLQPEMTVIEIAPDTIKLQFATMITKNVPVLANVKASFKQPSKLAGVIKTIPEYIEVSGPSTILDTMKYVYTNSYDFNDLEKSVLQKASLKVFNELKYSETKVIIDIPVDKFTEKSFYVPIFVKNGSERINLKLFPDKVNVKFQVSSSRFNEVIPAHFGFSVNFQDVEFSLSNKLKVNLDSQPDNLYYIQFEPAYVEYIIEK